MKVTVVPSVVEAMGTSAKALEKRFNSISIEAKITKSQKTVLIQTNRILQKVIEV